MYSVGGVPFSKFLCYFFLFKWRGHSRTFGDLSRSHSCIVLAVCLGSCWKVNLRHSLRSWALLFIFPSILSSLPVPATEKHPHSMMLPQLCFTVGMVPGFLQMWHLAFRPKSSILVSLEESCFSWPESIRCLLANFNRPEMGLLLKSGFRLATLP